MKLPGMILFWLKDVSIKMCTITRIMNMFSKENVCTGSKQLVTVRYRIMRNNFISCFDDFALISSFSSAFLTTHTKSHSVLSSQIFCRGRDLINYLIVALPGTILSLCSRMTYLQKSISREQKHL